MTQMTPLSDPRRKTLLQDFKAFYREASPASLERLDRLYTQDIEFRDPLNAIHGILALKSHLKGVYAGSTDIRFEYLDEHYDEHWALDTHMHAHLQARACSCVCVRAHTHTLTERDRERRR